MSEARPPASPNPLRQDLPRTQVPDPCAIVLFGATGDLNHRKLTPALYRLARNGLLPHEYAIVGFARRDWTDDQFRAEMAQSLGPQAGPDFSDYWGPFSAHLRFAGGTFDDPTAYARLKTQLEQVDAELGARGNRLFYLAVAPEFFATIIQHLGDAGLIYPAYQQSPWSRVVIEKPFGHDLDSALALNREVSSVLDESQTYRIDHYLGKETVQNIMAFRFGNTIFEPIWDRRYVEWVQITVAEGVGMPGTRGSYYDTSGAIRDMVQNHMMQLLCLVAMEPPVNLSADAIRNEKVKVLQALPRWTPEEVAVNTVRGQYAAGSIAGKDVPGYQQEKGVRPGSTTDTYVALRVTLDTWRWSGVPFFLRTGKRLPKQATEIAIKFRNPPTRLFQPDVEGADGVNLLVLRIQPKEGISLAFQAKIPGSRRRLQQVRMDFRYGTAFAIPSPEAYERLLLDALLGEPTLYTRTDEVENAWQFVDAILQGWKQSEGRPVPYPAGTWGPAAADALLARHGAVWRRL